MDEDDEPCNLCGHEICTCDEEYDAYKDAQLEAENA